MLQDNFTNENKPEIYAYVDGSYNPDTNTYGSGVFLFMKGISCYFFRSGDDPKMAELRNVAGELNSTMAVIKLAISLKLPSIHIYYDYKGIECWASTGPEKWKAKNKYTKYYADFINKAQRLIDITFEKVTAHSGVEGNEIADILAKHGAGITLSESDQEKFDSLNIKEYEY